jgi:hypothetical protein
MELQEALNNEIWINHKIGDTYSMIHIGGRVDNSNWKIAYYPLFGTYKNGVWIDFEEVRALVELKVKDGIIIQETPIRYLSKNNG